MGLGGWPVRPRHGWIRAIRSGLGMSQAALAARLGVTPAAVGKLERSEAHETISIGKLADAARALDCQLVYALVPNTSLEDTVQAGAVRASRAALGYVATTMALEDQALDEGQHSDQVARHAQWLIENNRVWRSP